MRLNKTKPWKVVLVPTIKGYLTSMYKFKLLGQYKDKLSADEFAYLYWVDEPAPDKVDFYRIEVIKFFR